MNQQQMQELIKARKTIPELKRRAAEAEAAANRAQASVAQEAATAAEGVRAALRPALDRLAVYEGIEQAFGAALGPRVADGIKDLGLGLAVAATLKKVFGDLLAVASTDLEQLDVALQRATGNLAGLLAEGEGKGDERMAAALRIANRAQQIETRAQAIEQRNRDLVAALKEARAESSRLRTRLSVIELDGCLGAGPARDLHAMLGHYAEFTFDKVAGSPSGQTVLDRFGRWAYQRYVRGELGRYSAGAPLPQPIPVREECLRCDLPCAGDSPQRHKDCAIDVVGYTANLCFGRWCVDLVLAKTRDAAIDAILPVIEAATGGPVPREFVEAQLRRIEDVLRICQDLGVDATEVEACLKEHGLVWLRCSTQRKPWVGNACVEWKSPLERGVFGIGDLAPADVRALMDDVRGHLDRGGAVWLYGYGPAEEDFPATKASEPVGLDVLVAGIREHIDRGGKIALALPGAPKPDLPGEPKNEDAAQESDCALISDPACLECAAYADPAACLGTTVPECARAEPAPGAVAECCLGKEACTACDECNHIPDEPAHPDLPLDESVVPEAPKEPVPEEAPTAKPPSAVPAGVVEMVCDGPLAAPERQDPGT